MHYAHHINYISNFYLFNGNGENGENGDCHLLYYNLPGSIVQAAPRKALCHMWNIPQSARDAQLTRVLLPEV